MKQWYSEGFYNAKDVCHYLTKLSANNIVPENIKVTCFHISYIIFYLHTEKIT